MYLELIILAVLILPIPVMYKVIADKQDPYKAITIGILSAGIGVLILFVVAYVSGDSLGKRIDEIIDIGVKTIVGNKEVMSALGLGEISEAKAISILKEAYSTVAAVLPAMLLTFGAVTAYIEYNILVRIKYMKTEGLKPIAYVRNFTLKRENVIGWFIIYLGAYLFKFVGLGAADTAVLNISVIVQSIVALQGISVIFLLFYKRRVHSIVAMVLIIIFWMMPVGKTALFTLGAIDLLVNLRARLA